MRKKIADLEFIYNNYGLLMYVGGDLVCLTREEAESLREFVTEAQFEEETLERAKRVDKARSMS